MVYKKNNRNSKGHNATNTTGNTNARDRTTTPECEPLDTQNGTPNSKGGKPLKWEPMAHSCSMCHAKTTSASFRRSCLGVHEVPCYGYHKTLMRYGREESCDSCRTEREARLKAGRNIKAQEKRFENAEKSQEKKKEEDKLQYMKAIEDRHIKNTKEEYQRRKIGYQEWASRRA